MGFSPRNHNFQQTINAKHQLAHIIQQFYVKEKQAPRNDSNSLPKVQKFTYPMSTGVSKEPTNSYQNGKKRSTVCKSLPALHNWVIYGRLMPVPNWVKNTNGPHDWFVAPRGWGNMHIWPSAVRASRGPPWNKQITDDDLRRRRLYRKELYIFSGEQLN